MKMNPTLAVSTNLCRHVLGGISTLPLTDIVHLLLRGYKQASLNGNKPARGARIDKELMEEDQMILEKMDKKKMMMMDGMSGRYI